MWRSEIHRRIKLNDIIVSVAVKKYGSDLGHKFDDQRCVYCNIEARQFYELVGGLKRANKTILCEKSPNIPKKIEHKPRIQNTSKSEFWLLLYNYYKSQKKIYSTFKDSFEYFWREHRINRSTFKKLFNEIYQERRFDGRNAIHVYGSPSGTFKDEDRLPMQTPRGYREWSIWGIDDFDKNDSSYVIEKKRIET